ncbi:hypothetical protein BLNAU_22797 [Blattamonas nauphoetae]|uniref:Uncharacterized protein n=1 Tax=Blattamonas nauphoetae TaxID=2049346 RepID=A0ABQ9WS11_9EUKA|nr:hypothetical protein BLNAU_22797 [Blattamonas nauphoetae]
MNGCTKKDLRQITSRRAGEHFEQPIQKQKRLPIIRSPRKGNFEDYLIPAEIERLFYEYHSQRKLRSIDSDVELFKKHNGAGNIDDVDRDGNCWLASVLSQRTLHERARLHPQKPEDDSECLNVMRRLTMDELEANTALYEHLMAFRPDCSTEETFNARGRMDYTDGALAELTALSVFLGRQLVIRVFHFAGEV